MNFELLTRYVVDMNSNIIGMEYKIVILIVVIKKSSIVWNILNCYIKVEFEKGHFSYVIYQHQLFYEFKA